MRTAADWIKTAGLVLALGLNTVTGWAQTFPNKLMTMVVPYPAGGPSDFVARTIQPDLVKQLGQQIIVDNVGGVGGALGVQKVLQAPADGHTLLLATPMELVLTPLGIASARHKPEDLRPVAVVATTSLVLLARKDIGAASVEELIAQARKPGAKELSYGSVGSGSLYHLTAEVFAQRAGLKMLHIPYKGAAPLLTDLMGGQIDLVFMPMAGGVPALIRDAKVKAFGVTAQKPHFMAPDLPALATLKGFEGFEFDVWVGLQVARGTPDTMLDTLNKAVYAILKRPEIRKALESTGNRLTEPASPAELGRQYAAEVARYQAIAKAANVQPQ